MESLDYITSMSNLLHSMRTGIQGGLLMPLETAQRKYPDDIGIKNALKEAKNLFVQAEFIDLIKAINLNQNIEDLALKTSFFSTEKTEDGFLQVLEDTIRTHNSNGLHTEMSLKTNKEAVHLNKFIKKSIFITKLFNEVFITKIIWSLYGSTFTKKDTVQVELIIKENGVLLAVKNKSKPYKKDFTMIDSILRSLKIGKVEIESTEDLNFIGFLFD